MRPAELLILERDSSSRGPEGLASRNDKFRGGMVLLGAVAAFFLLLPGCSNPVEVGRRPNVILLTVDALRADHVSSYGYERETTPFIDSLAGRGTLFRNAYGTSSWTAPSMASLFTGLYPRSHGVQRGSPKDGKIISQEVLDSEFTTLAEILKENGYSTYGISSNGHMSPETGMAQGFGFFKTFWFRPSPPAHKAAMELKPDLLSSEPFFLWIHYFDPHAPYHARKPWVAEYATDMALTMEWQGRLPSDLAKNKGVLRKNPNIVSAIIDAYDSEINFSDNYIRKLLEDERLTSNTIVIVTADHGEAFLDHNQLGHGRTLYEEEIRVPLIVVLPDGATAGESSQDVSLVDIYPTVLDYLGIPIPSQSQGKSLLPFIEDATLAEERPIVCELNRGFRQVSIKENDWKLIRPPKQATRKKWKLYDLSVDPLEQQNLRSKHRDEANRLNEDLAGWQSKHPEHHAQAVDSDLSDDQKEVLRSMGYAK